MSGYQRKVFLTCLFFLKKKKDQLTTVGFGPANDSSAGRQIFEKRGKKEENLGQGRRKGNFSLFFLSLFFFFFLLFFHLLEGNKGIFFSYFPKPVYWLKAPFRNSGGILFLCAWGSPQEAEKRVFFCFFRLGVLRVIQSVSAFSWNVAGKG